MMSENRRLISLEAAIFVPAVFWESFCNGEASSKSREMEEYSQGLNRFALAETFDYRGFRKFLAANSGIFKEKYNLLKTITNLEIDYVLRRRIEELQELRGTN